MHELLKQILVAAMAALAGLLLFDGSSAGSASQTLGMLVLLLEAVSLLFSVRDLVHLGLQRRGLSTTKDEAFTHLCAALMLVLALAAGSDYDPRLQGRLGGRWSSAFRCRYKRSRSSTAPCCNGTRHSV